MSRRSFLYASLALGSLTIAACLALAGRARLSASQAPAPSFEYVTVWGADGLDPQTLANYQALADAIARFSGVPNARWTYYGAYNDGVNWAIGSWGASVSSAVADPNGGYNVTLLVGPNFTVTTQDANIVGGTYTEIFHVAADGTVTYISSQDPDGNGGGQLIEIAA